MADSQSHSVGEHPVGKTPPEIVLIPEMPKVPSRRNSAKSKPVPVCRECKRLKLKCDKKFPCSTCVRRGCAAICPDGVLVTGKGSRFIVSGTEDLFDRIDTLAERVRALEEGLDSAWREGHDNDHPLLTEHLREIKACRPLLIQDEERATARGSAVGRVNEEEYRDVVEILEAPPNLSSTVKGTLNVVGKDYNSTRYYGATARTEWLVLDPEDLTAGEEPLDADIQMAADLFPFYAIKPTHDFMRRIYGSLPVEFDAARLCQIYHNRCRSIYNPLPPSSFVDTLIEEIYRPPPSHELNLHRLGLFYMIIAKAALQDPAKALYNDEAYRYFSLAKACLASRCVMENPSVPALQALHIILLFLLMGNRKPESSWMYLGIATHCAYSLGIHHDDFPMPDDSQEERRNLWWELLTIEHAMCLAFGRPSSFNLRCCTTRFPTYQKMGDETGFHQWMHKFTRTIVTQVLEVALGNSIDYDMICRLVDRIKRFEVPSLLASTSQILKSADSDLTTKKSIVRAFKALTILKINTGWFAEVLSKTPHDINGSPYYSSVISVHKSSLILIGILEALASAEFEMVSRWGLYWSNAFNSATSLTLIATRASRSELAQSAFEGVDTCLSLFRRGKESGVVIATLSMPTLEKFHRKAYDAVKNIDTFEGRSPGASGISTTPNTTSYFSHPDARWTSPRETSSVEPEDADLVSLHGRMNVRHREQRRPELRESGSQIAISESSMRKGSGSALQEKAGISLSFPSSRHETGYVQQPLLANQDPIGSAHSGNHSSHWLSTGTPTRQTQPRRNSLRTGPLGDQALPCSIPPAGASATIPTEAGARKQRSRHPTTAQEPLASVPQYPSQMEAPSGSAYQDQQRWHNLSTSYAHQQEYVPSYAAYQHEVLQVSDSSQTPLAAHESMILDGRLQHHLRYQHQSPSYPLNPRPVNTAPDHLSGTYAYEYGTIPSTSTSFDTNPYLTDPGEYFPVGFVGSYAMDQDPPMVSRDPRFKEQQQMMTDMIMELHK